MCGIVGLISKTRGGFFTYHADLFTNMLQMDSIRGEDSTGVFGVTKTGQLDYLKGDADGYKFTRCEDYERFRQQIWREYAIVIGHNRKATKGAVNAQNAHPFVSKHICLVHNGTIYNSKTLNETVEVDSEAIAHALAEHDAPAALNKLNGPFALAWFDKKDQTLSLARNEHRNLHLIEYEDYWVISSEIGLPLWLQGRADRPSKSNRLVPTDKILVFSLKDLTKDPVEVAYEEYKHYIPPKMESPYAPVVHQFPRVQHPPQTPALLQEKIKSAGLKQGDVVKFKASSYNDQNAGDRSLIGNPVFDNEMDANIIVQAILPKDESVFQYLAQGEFFTATVINIRPMLHRLVVFARDPVALKLVSDCHGTTHPQDEVIGALLKGCGRCFKDMFFRDIGASVIQKKKDGTWRLLCSTCVQTSISNAKKDKSLILPAVNSVQ